MSDAAVPEIVGLPEFEYAPRSDSTVSGAIVSCVTVFESVAVPNVAFTVSVPSRNEDRSIAAVVQVLPL